MTFFNGIINGLVIQKFNVFDAYERVKIETSVIFQSAVVHFV